MQRKNIPAYVLAKGISKTGFEKLLADIRKAAIEDGIDKFNDYNEMLEFIKINLDDESFSQWVNDFETQMTESTKIINDNVNQIENLFNKIFEDWEVYKKENNIVEEIQGNGKIDLSKSGDDNLDKKETSKKTSKKKSKVAKGDSDE